MDIPIQVRDSSKALYTTTNGYECYLYKTKGVAMTAALIMVHLGYNNVVVVNRKSNSIVYNASEAYNTDKILIGV